MVSPSDACREKLSATLLDPVQAAAIDVGSAVESAVLVPLYAREGRVHAIFTERHHQLSRHAGEISFPGGRRDPEDSDLIATALREAREEVGLDPEDVEIVGALLPVQTIASGYVIYPFVGLIPADVRWAPSATEVAAVIDLPLADVAAGYGRRRVQRRGGAIRTDTYLVGEHMIWGATARIVADLLERAA